MPLLLTVRCPDARRLANGYAYVIGPSGGHIGRAVTNDIVLPDPECFVSGRHATITRLDGTWLLTDVSSNGVFVNDATDRLVRGQPCVLHHGDRVRIGVYEIAVTVTPDATFSGDERQPPPVKPAPAAKAK